MNMKISIMLLSLFLASPISHAALIQYNESIDGDIENKSFAPVNSGDTLEITGSVIQGPGVVNNWDIFTVTLLDDWVVNATFELINTVNVVDFTSHFGVIYSVSGDYLNYASGVAGAYSFDPVPQANTGTINYTYTFIVGEQSTDVPAPSTFMLLGLGLAAIGFTRKRTTN